MRKFFGEFKKFITRGNVLDMAVGVIVGGAFTAIVNGMSNFILKPIINWVLALVFGSNSLSGIFTYLKKVEVDGVVDLTQSIYIDWGAFINAVINFLLIAMVLFVIIRTINNVKDRNEKLKKKLEKGKLTKEDKKILKERGIKRYDFVAVKEYLAEKEQLLAKKAEQEKLEAEEKAKADRLANPTTEDLLKDIKALLEKQVK